MRRLGIENVDTAVVHCTATPPDMDIGVEEIRRWHVRDRGWDDIGYHFVIRLDGTVERGRSIDHMGAHVRGHNDHTIGIAYVGGLDDEGTAADTLNAAQEGSLRNVLQIAFAVFNDLNIVGHRDLDFSKECPCFDVPAWASEQTLLTRSGFMDGLTNAIDKLRNAT